MTPFPFSPVNDAMLLRAAGYTRMDYEARWEDVGGPENGPKLVGHDAFTAWVLPCPAKGAEHVIIVVDDMVVQADMEPAGPEGWEDQF